jgi:hypothetical protein
MTAGYLSNVVLCDVDGDGLSDMVPLEATKGAVVLYGRSNGFANAAGTLLMPPYDISGATGIQSTTGYNREGCIPGFRPGAPLLLGSPGTSSGGTHTGPSWIDVAGGKPAAVATKVDTPSPADTGFGNLVVHKPADFNGDGKLDGFVYSDFKFWIVYGR